jgi:SAM-dependent methyltransferase
MSTTEFDEYAAHGYQAGMEHPLKRLVGRSASDFIERKAVWLLAEIKRCCGASALHSGLRILDFGCGTGDLLRLLDQSGLQCTLQGCDVSKGMLACAAARCQGTSHCTGRSAPRFDLLEGDTLPYEDGAFDVVIMSGVLHHIPLERQAATLRELRRVVSGGGALYVFEHNPWNIITRWVVSHTRIDRNAVLVSCVAVRRMLAEAGFVRSCTQHILFFPVRWKWTWSLEHLLRRTPIGGQYVVRASRS